MDTTGLGLTRSQQNFGEKKLKLNALQNVQCRYMITECPNSSMIDNLGIISLKNINVIFFPKNI
jgi:hypothetical protein